MTDFPFMPDHLAALERDLRAAATQPAVPVRRRPVGRLALGLALVGALVATLVLATGPDGRRTEPAFAGPLILREPTVPIPQRFRTLGLTALYAQAIHRAGEDAARKDFEELLESGARVRTRTARRIPAFGGTAYLLGAPDVWCLTAPDPAANDPDIEVGVACVPAREFARIGIALTVGRHYVAAVPQDVPDPQLKRADGIRVGLEPHENGLVVVPTLAQGESVIRTDARGRTRVDRGPAAPRAKPAPRREP